MKTGVIYASVMLAIIRNIRAIELFIKYDMKNLFLFSKNISFLNFSILKLNFNEMKQANIIAGIYTMFCGSKAIKVNMKPFLPKLSVKKAMENPKQKPLYVIYNGARMIPKYVILIKKSIIIGIMLFFNDALKISPLSSGYAGISMKNLSMYVFSIFFASVDNIPTQKAPMHIPIRISAIRKEYINAFIFICLSIKYLKRLINDVYLLAFVHF